LTIELRGQGCCSLIIEDVDDRDDFVVRILGLGKECDGGPIPPATTTAPPPSQERIARFSGSLIIPKSQEGIF